jgi:hypothetical protein
MKNIIKKVIEKLHELCIGLEQIGKSHTTMDDSKDRLIQYTNIQIHFAFGTEEIEENQYYHVDRVFGEMENVKIIRGLAEVRSLRQLLQKGDVSVLNDGRLVISCIGNYHALQEILSLVSMTDPQHGFMFDVFIDESDTYGVDHDRTVSNVQKDNLVNSIADSPQVCLVREITATPMSQTVSQSNYTKIYEIEGKQGYNGVEDFVFNATLQPKDLKDFESNKHVPAKIKQWIMDGIKIEGQISLISTDHRIAKQVKMAETVSRVVGMAAPVVVVNSSKDQHVYFNGKIASSLCKGKLRKILDACRIQGHKNVFVIGQRCLNRSITIEDSEKYYDACRILFNTTDTAADPEVLQRVARIAGYGPHKREVTCTPLVEMRVKKASANRSNLVKDIVKIKNHEERRAKLLEYDGLMKTNIFGKKNNGYKVITQHTNKRESITKQPRYICLNRVTHYSAENFDDSRVLQQLNNGDAARPGTPLYEWLSKRHPFNNILNALSSGQNQIRIHLPNIKSESNNKTYRRDCLYHWDQDNQKLAVSEQGRDEFKQHYSMLDPVSGDYFNYMVMKEGAGDRSVIVIDTLHDSQAA